jgi:hypothetical protein
VRIEEITKNEMGRMKHILFAWDICFSYSWTSVEIVRPLSAISFLCSSDVWGNLYG